MKFIATVLVCLLATQAFTAPSVKPRCSFSFTKDDLIGFDLIPVKASGQPIIIENGASKAQLQFCSAILQSSIPDGWNCPVIGENLVFVNEAGKCLAVTTPDTTFISEYTTDSDKKTTGIVITYNNDKVKDEDKAKLYGKNLKFTIACNKDILNSNAVWTYDTSDAAFINFKTAAAAGCGYSLKDFLEFFNKNKYIFGAAFVAIGILFTFFGRRFFSITLILVGFLIGFLTVAGAAYVTNAFAGADTKKVVVLFVISVLLGCLIGYLFNKFKVISTMGAVGVLFFFIATAVLRLYLATTITNSWAKLGITALVVVIGVAFGYFYSKFCIMFSTSFGGAFLVVFAIGTLSNTLDSPTIIEQKIKDGEKIVRSAHSDLRLRLGKHLAGPRSRRPHRAVQAQPRTRRRREER